MGRGSKSDVRGIGGRGKWEKESEGRYQANTKMEFKRIQIGRRIRCKVNES